MDVARDGGADDGEAGKASTPRGNLGPVFSSLERLPPISARSWDGPVEEIPSTVRCRGAFPSRAAPRHSLLHRPPHSLTPHAAYSRSPLPHPLAASRPARRSPPARGPRFGDAPGPILKLSPPFHRDRTDTSVLHSGEVLKRDARLGTPPLACPCRFFPPSPAHGHLVPVDMAVFRLALSTATHPLFQHRSSRLPAPPPPSRYRTTGTRST
ncbi:hypothetical protein B0H14DRAFT_361787 [Mycena olivaceomarginata]|nr:hypothetical protein B0H14DRAFT_361787 [Mycena olivaceomarginata]